MSEEKKQFEYGQELIDYSKHLFDRYAVDFDTLDNKALGVIGIAGILIGFQALNIDTTAEIIKCFESGFYWLPCCALITLATHAFFLILCILKALAAFQVKDFDYPGNVDDLLVNVKIKQDLLRNITNTYKDITLSIEKINNQKAAELKKSVQFIIIAIMSLVAFIFFMILLKCE
jgi:hypothetical protein